MYRVKFLRLVKTLNLMGYYELKRVTVSNLYVHYQFRRVKRIVKKNGPGSQLISVLS